MRRRKRIKRIYQLRKLTKALAILGVSFILFHACQKEPSLNKKVVLSEVSVLPNKDCSTKYIKIGGPYFEGRATRKITLNGKTKTVEIRYFNTETEMVIKINSSEGWNNLHLNGEPVWQRGQVAPDTWETYTYPLPIDWQACDLQKLDLQVIGNGPPAIFKVRYNLYGLC